MPSTNSDTCLLYADVAFKSLIGEPHPFGSKSGPNHGFSDGNQGVQWNIDIDKESCEAKLGVNLEGLKYSHWPIAVFIESELKNHNLIKTSRQIDHSSKIFVSLFRDAWQAASRPPIKEKLIGEARLDRLTKSRWDDMLQEAYQCLDCDRGYRGRATQLVNLIKSGKRLKEVSPHLHIHTELWGQIPLSEQEAEELLKSAVEVLSPIHNFVKNSISSD